eukprot:1938840-Pleurochrysis_carterae.AAC.1
MIRYLSATCGGWIVAIHLRTQDYCTATAQAKVLQRHESKASLGGAKDAVRTRLLHHNYLSTQSAIFHKQLCFMSRYVSQDAQTAVHTARQEATTSSSCVRSAIGRKYAATAGSKHATNKATGIRLRHCATATANKGLRSTSST